MVMTPAWAHRRIDVLVKAGAPPRSVVGAPTIQGPAGAGMQGMGVKLPNAAAVAAATTGLDKLRHITNPGTLRPGMLSKIFPQAPAPLVVRWVGKKFNVQGAVPKEHLQIAPVTTDCGIY